MSEDVRIHNPLGQPVIYTGRGHQLDGYTGTMADSDEPITARLIEQGRIVVVAKPTPPPVITRPTRPKTTTPAEGKEETN
ncbi:hypothetical protein ACSYDW_07080 [Paeniglutamicibacter sp. R2-26]|uniref:hypothetical protein n=1 Tax=Paeniglutamicibacter sp. R2-26 TaxID=3144417 RepID=UPI003EE73298